MTIRHVFALCALLGLAAACTDVDLDSPETDGVATVRLTLDGDVRAGAVETIAVAGDTLVWGASGEIKVWDIDSGRELTTLPHDNDSGGFSVAISPDGGTIAAVSDRRILAWDVATREETLLIEHGLGGGGKLALTFSPDGKTLVAHERLWDVVTGEVLNDFTFPSVRCCTASAALAADGRTLVFPIPSVRDERRVGIVVIDVDSGERRLVETAPSADNRVLSVAASADGRIAATGAGPSGVVRLWDIETGQVRVLEGHTARVWTVAFSPDDRFLASASWDGTVRLWNVATGEQAAILEGLTRYYAVAFTDDGQTVIAGGQRGDGVGREGQITVWDFPF